MPAGISPVCMPAEEAELTGLKEKGRQILKFIHTADLHLDSAMESNFTPEQARIRRDELLDTFDRMIEFAAQNRVRAVLISGDLFDRPHNRRSAKKRVLEGIGAHPEIDFLYLKGNHDNVDFLSETDPSAVPENLKLFSTSEWTSYDYDEAVISGREITADNIRTLPDSLVLDRARTNIVMLHGQETGSVVSTDRTEVISLPAFAGKNIDYMALGHIHSFMQGKIDDRGTWCYPGCPEGRGFDECGRKGFCLLDVHDGQIDVQFIPFARRTLHEVNVDITGTETMREVFDLAEKACAGIPSDDLVKFVLTGQIGMEMEPDIDRVVRNFSDRFWFVKAEDATSLRIDYENFRNDRSLKGEFVRLLENEDLPEERRAAVIETGVRAILGEEIEE